MKCINYFLVGFLILFCNCKEKIPIKNYEYFASLSTKDSLSKYPQLAFPSARGAGAFTTGGRGKKVFIVKNLNDSGEGSLREAHDLVLENNGGIIVFGVSGTIELQDFLRFKADNVTIAGQSAPEGGITITGSKIEFNDSDNLIIRYIRFRPDYDAPTFVADAVSFRDCDNVIVDHCSFSWGKDEVVSANVSSKNITWQNNLIAEGKTGSIFGDSNDPSKSDSLSFHNNVFYNISHRFPNINTNGRADIINNIVFNWKYRLISASPNIKLNHINNYYIKGCVKQIDGLVNKLMKNGTAKIYTAGNFITEDLMDDEKDNLFIWEYYNSDGATINYIHQASKPYELLGYPLNVKTAKTTFSELLENVGVNERLDKLGNKIENLDFLDAMYIHNIKIGDCIPYVSSSNGSNYMDQDHYIKFHEQVSNNPIAIGPTDINNDGIPDEWAKTKGFSTSEKLTAYVWPSGYVGIEEYLNEIDNFGKDTD